MDSEQTDKRDDLARDAVEADEHEGDNQVDEEDGYGDYYGYYDYHDYEEEDDLARDAVEADGDWPEGQQESLPIGLICGCCYGEGLELSSARCREKPELLLEAPIGMYHCPDCGAMLLAGTEHPCLCEKCQPIETQKMTKEKALERIEELRDGSCSRSKVATLLNECAAAELITEQICNNLYDILDAARENAGPVLNMLSKHLNKS